MSTGIVAPPQPGVAPWCLPDDIESATTIALTGVDLAMVAQAATDILYPLSGRQWKGVHRSNIRPARMAAGCGCLPYPYGGWSTWTSIGPTGILGGASPVGWGSWPGCGCGPSTELVLQGPVIQIVSVTVDGSQLAGGVDYLLYDHRRLVRAGTSPQSSPGWPCCQNLGLPLTAVGTWGVTYDWGSAPPAVGRLAAIELGVELALALNQNSACRLPGRVTNLVREGVSAVIQDPLVFVEKSLTGLPTVDQFLMAYNPHNRRRRARVVTPSTVQRHTS